jgi:hypothetical protein
MYYDQQGVLPGPDGGLALTPETKRRMITLPIEDRRHGTDELAEVHVPLRLLARATFGQMQRMYVWPCKVSRHVSMVRARAAASEEIKLTNFLFRSRKGVHHAWKVSTDVSACFCRWRRDDSVGQLEG